jgi:hypothetical protein
MSVCMYACMYVCHAALESRLSFCLGLLVQLIVACTFSSKSLLQSPYGSCWEQGESHAYVSRRRAMTDMHTCDEKDFEEAGVISKLTPTRLQTVTDRQTLRMC